MFSQTTEYALRAMVALAESGGALSAAQLAERTQVPPPYLAKVLQNLARGGLLQAMRGKMGGYRLSRSPTEISILDIVSAVDPIRRIARCPLGRPEHAEGLCALHHEMDEALRLVEERLGACKLQDLLEGREI